MECQRFDQRIGPAILAGIVIAVLGAPAAMAHALKDVKTPDKPLVLEAHGSLFIDGGRVEPGGNWAILSGRAHIPADARGGAHGTASPATPHFRTVVVAVAVLFARSGSGAFARVVAVLVSVTPLRDGLTTTVTVAVANALRVPSPQVSPPSRLRVHDPCVGVAETNTAFAGS